MTDDSKLIISTTSENSETDNYLEQKKTLKPYEKLAITLLQ